MSFAKKDPSLSLRCHGFFAAAKGYGRELSQAVGFVLGCLTLTGLGLLILRKQATGSQQLRAARRPLPAFFTGFFLLYSGVLFAGASRFGYIESRHLLPAVIALVPLAIDAVAAISSGLELRAASPKPGERVVPLRRTPLRFAYLVCVALAFVSLVPRAHASRTTHRAAAKWLAQTDLPAGTVLDTRGWTQFYSGRTTHLLSAGRAALKDPQLRYIVLERQELEFDSTRAATLREIVGSSSKPVAIFAADDGPHKDVLVYQWQAERFATRKTRLAQR